MQSTDPRLKGLLVDYHWVVNDNRKREIQEVAGVAQVREDGFLRLRAHGNPPPLELSVQLAKRHAEVLFQRVKQRDNYEAIAKNVTRAKHPEGMLGRYFAPTAHHPSLLVDDDSRASIQSSDLGTIRERGGTYYTNTMDPIGFSSTGLSLARMWRSVRVPDSPRSLPFRLTLLITRTS